MLENSAKEGDSPVIKSLINSMSILSNTRHVKPCVNLRRPLRKAKY